MQKKCLIIFFIITAFVITFSSLYFYSWRYPNVEESIDILERSMKEHNKVPRKNVWYTLNHETGIINMIDKPKEIK